MLNGLNFFKIFSDLVHSVKLSGFRKNRLEFYEQLAKSLEAKEQLRDFFAAELKISKAKKTRDDSRAYALQTMARKLARSDEYSLSAILLTVMPADDSMILAALDVSKDKVSTLRALSHFLLESQEAKKIFWGAVVPPMIVLPGVFAFTYILSTQSIPVITKVAPPEVWTPFNAMVRGFAESFAENVALILLLFVAVVGAFPYVASRWKGKARGWLESQNMATLVMLSVVFPYALPLKLYKDFQVTIMLSSMAVLLQSGSTLMDALNTVRKASNPWMKWHITRIIKHLQDYPKDYIPAFSKGLLGASTLARLATSIRNTPQFDGVLISAGTKGAKEIREEIKKTSKAVNLLLMVSVAGLVIFLYLGQLSISMTMSEALDPTTRLMKMNR